MAAAVVQENSGHTGATTPASVNPTLASDTTLGNQLVLIMSSDAVIATPSGWVLDASSVFGNGHYVFRKYITAAEDSWTITIGSASTAWWIAEVSGLVKAPRDAFATTGSGSPATTRSSGTATTQAAATYLIASYGQSAPNPPVAVTWSGYTNSFVERIDIKTTKGAGVDTGLAVADRSVTSAAAYESTATAAPAAVASTGLLVAYEAVAADGVAGIAFTEPIFDAGGITTDVAIASTWLTTSKTFTSGFAYTLLTAHTASGGTSRASGVTGASGTWVNVGEFVNVGALSPQGTCVQVWECRNASGTGQLTVTVGTTNSSGHAWGIHEAREGFATNGTLGGAVEAVASANGNSTAPSVDVGTPLSHSAILGACVVGIATDDFTAGSQFTEVGGGGYSTPTFRMQHEFDGHGNTDGVTDGTLAVSKLWGMVVVELKAASAAGPGVTLQRKYHHVLAN